MNCEKWNKIDLFIGMEEDPLKKYEYYFQNIDFSKSNYCFIIPDLFSDLFSSFYTKILKNSFIFFPKDFQQAQELLNDYENEEGYKKNWIIISPCMELEKNIKNFHENIDIIYFIGYCPIFNHKHSDLYSFSKFKGIFNSCSELIEELFILSNISYYRNKQNYIISNNNEIIELKYNSKFLFDIKDNSLKEQVINEKFYRLLKFKIADDEYYFTFIKSYNFVSKCIKEKNYSIFGNLENFIFFSDFFFEKKLLCSLFLQELHLLFLYFSNYPYLYGILTDEEIDKILTRFKPNMDKKSLQVFLVLSFDSMVNIVGVLAMNVQKGKSILEEKEQLKNFHELLIKFIFAFDQLNNEINIEKFSKYYQIKNYIRDIDFCLGRFLVNVLGLCGNYPLFSDVSRYIRTEIRYRDYIFYSLHLKKDNITPENEQEKIFNEAIRYNDTIVIGDKNFIDLIKKINLPCKNKYYLNEKNILGFFENPKTINNKYNICKYFIIMNETNGIESLETIKYISNYYALKIIIIIYIRNKNYKIDKK